MGLQEADDWGTEVGHNIGVLGDLQGQQSRSASQDMVVATLRILSRISQERKYFLSPSLFFPIPLPLVAPHHEREELNEVDLPIGIDVSKFESLEQCLAQLSSLESIPGLDELLELDPA